MKVLTLSVVAVALVAAMGASPAWAFPDELDPAFGTNGISQTDVLTAGYENQYGAGAFTPSGRLVMVGTNPNMAEWRLVELNPDGTLADDFGEGGVVDLMPRQGWNSAHAVVVQPDGKILAGGGISSDRGPGNRYTHLAVVRFLPDGQRDWAFGNRGKVIVPVRFSLDEVVTSLALQRDGKILAAGFARTDTWRIALMRLLPDGRLDPSFGDGGLVIGAPGSGEAMVVQPNGKILVASGCRVVRYLADGRLDEAFGEDGEADCSLNTGFGVGLALTGSRGFVVAGGYVEGRQDADFGVARFNTKGQLVPSFGRFGGIAEVGFAPPAEGEKFGSTDDATAVAVLPDGEIVLAGRSSSPWGAAPDVALVRLSPSGHLVRSWGTNGKVVTHLPDTFDIVTSALLVGQALTLTGTNYATRDYHFLAVRYLV
jgi:uncharacterized delta-60 repeat protein